MKKLFHQFYQFTEDEFKALWENCSFALDASVLLNPYRYSEPSAQQLLSLFQQISSRIVIPYQFASEFQRNRISTISEQIKNYQEAETILENFDTHQIKPNRKHPFLSPNSVAEFEKIRNELKESRERYEALFLSDPYLELITETITQIGSAPTDLNALHIQAKVRYSSSIPPGYEDQKKKSEPECYGDCIGWLQLLEMAKATQKPFILVTDDAKMDWWQIVSGRRIGPRPELKEEFFRECGQPFHLYSCDQFMSFARTFLSATVTTAAIEEAKEHVEERLRSNAIEKPVSPQESAIVRGEKPDGEPKSEDLKPTQLSTKEIESDLNLKTSI